MLTWFETWIQSTWLNKFMVGNPAAFTTAETLHFMGLTVLMGSLLVIDLRGLGFLKRMPLLEVHKLVPFAIGAFAVQLITGIGFISTNPHHYFEDLSFQLKMLLIPIAGVNALVFEFFVFRPLKAGNTAIEDGALIKITSGLSLLAWSLVLIFGRLIPYL